MVEKEKKELYHVGRIMKIIISKKSISTENYNSYHIGSIVLKYNNWNDYGYYTSYDVFYYDGSELRKIGIIKIYNKKLDLEETNPEFAGLKVGIYLPDDTIECLSDDCCSLGQSVDYYKNLKTYCGEEYEGVLTKLRDMATNDVIMEEFGDAEGVKRSLLREVSAQKALSDAKQILNMDIKSDDGVEDYETIGVQIGSDKDDIYPYSSVKIERNQFSIYELKRKYEKGRLCLDPSFQRHFVWSLKQQSELIESVIMGIPLPLIYLAENRDGQLVVVDGQQRLTTFIRFLDNEFRLSGLNVLNNLNGKNYNDLDRDNPNYISMIEDYQLVIQVIKYPTPDRIRFDIFDRVNRGGTPLNKQEMRNALYQGASTKFLQELAECDEFKNATGNAVSGRHMKDRYLVLRAIAFSLVHQQKLVDRNGKTIEYKSDMDDLMAKTMEYLNFCEDDVRRMLADEFRMIMSKSYHVLGQDAFRVRNGSGRRRPISMTLFETVYYLLFLLLDKQISDQKILCIYSMLCDDDDFMDAVQYSVDSSKNVGIRFQKVIYYAKEVAQGWQLKG